MSWDNVHRMLVGGPLDNIIVHVQNNVDPYQVHIKDPMPKIETWASIKAADETVVESAVGRYWLDEFMWGDNTQKFYRWQDTNRKVASKIYMRRMGMSLWEIYHKVEWSTWEDVLSGN